MKYKIEPPWTVGPGEILRHGISLLSDDTDTNRRLAMISVDNSVELMMQTFVQLPRRITGLDMPRKERDEICSTFPNLLDGIEKHAGSKIIGINLGEIEWFHRLRNQLYHQGNGLTVERQKVEVYAEIASTFFRALFDIDLDVSETREMQLLGEFLASYIEIENSLRNAARSKRFSSGKAILEGLDNGVLSKSDYVQFSRIRELRNAVVHSSEGINLLDKDVVSSAKRIAGILAAAYPLVPE